MQRRTTQPQVPKLKSMLKWYRNWEPKMRNCLVERRSPETWMSGLSGSFFLDLTIHLAAQAKALCSERAWLLGKLCVRGLAAAAWEGLFWYCNERIGLRVFSCLAHRNGPFLSACAYNRQRATTLVPRARRGAHTTAIIAHKSTRESTEGPLMNASASVYRLFSTLFNPP